MLADARRDAYRPQPSFRRDRRHPGDGDGLSGLLRRHSQGLRHVRRAPEQSGYACAWFGKNHNVPDNQTSPAGPFDNWPTNQGFDYFYGFIAGETDQFYPSLDPQHDAGRAAETPEEGYQLTRDLADECIDWIRQQKAIAPDRPFIAYSRPAQRTPRISRRSIGAARTRGGSTWAGTGTASRP